METLRNGLPLKVQSGEYHFSPFSYPPQRVGDEAVIFTAIGLRRKHVILLRGTGRKKWLVDVEQLQRMIRQQQNLALYGTLEAP